MRERIWLRIESLAENPRPHGSKLLRGALEGHYRVRVGDYRVVYTVDDQQRRVWVIRIGPRGSVYDGGAG
jgi:mRNA interferase RelE/StbE